MEKNYENLGYDKYKQDVLNSIKKIQDLYKDDCKILDKVVKIFHSKIKSNSKPNMAKDLEKDISLLLGGERELRTIVIYIRIKEGEKELYQEILNTINDKEFDREMVYTSLLISEMFMKMHQYQENPFGLLEIRCLNIIDDIATLEFTRADNETITFNINHSSLQEIKEYISSVIDDINEQEDTSAEKEEE